MDNRLLAIFESHSDKLLKELAECSIKLENDPSDGRLKNRKLDLTKLIFENEQQVIDAYQKYQNIIFIQSPTEKQDREEVKLAIAEIDKHQGELNEPAILEKIENLTQLIEETKTELPSAFVKAWDENLKLQKKSSVTGKFKLVIPIIPKVFTYEKEMPYNLLDEFRKMREDFKNGHYFLYPKKN